jgi:hypothetical protein
MNWTAYFIAINAGLILFIFFQIFDSQSSLQSAAFFGLASLECILDYVRWE